MVSVKVRSHSVDIPHEKKPDKTSVGNALHSLLLAEPYMIQNS